jgi:hypothetical protein
VLAYSYLGKVKGTQAKHKAKALMSKVKNKLRESELPETKIYHIVLVAKTQL